MRAIRVRSSLDIAAKPRFLVVPAIDPPWLIGSINCTVPRRHKQLNNSQPGSQATAVRKFIVLVVTNGYYGVV